MARLPYTKEEVDAMTDPAEKLRAMAELRSAIFRRKQEVLDEESRQSQLSNAGSRYSPQSTTSYHAHRSYAGSRGNFRGYGPRRGGSANYSSHRPTYRPYEVARPSKFGHKSVTFTQPNASSKAPKATASAARSPGSAPTKTEIDQSKPVTPCPTFTRTGKCARYGCPHLHDSDKVAICKTWLYKGDCPKGAFCPLSHTANPHITPTCEHFQDSRCNNDACRFAHIRVNPSALNCMEFGTSGYCSAGSTCTQLHAHECPEFANTGTCHYGDKCRLTHVIRAARMRKAGESAVRSSSAKVSPPTDPKEIKNESVVAAQSPSKDNTSSSPTPRPFTQQADFLPFDE